MLILFPVLLLLLSALAMVVIRLFRPDFVYHWLIALAGALLAWPIMLVGGLNLPLSIPLITWRPTSLFPASPMLLVDRLSWPYAVALATLVLAAILTDVVRAAEADWSAWGGDLALAAFGILAALAGNPLTMLLGWTVIDFGEFIVMMSQITSSSVRERVVVSFSARVTGSGFLLAAVLVAALNGEALTFTAIPARAKLFLILAAGLRLGVIPLHFPFLGDISLRRNLGTLVRLTPAAASLVLLARTASVGETTAFQPLVLGLTALVALFSSGAWVLAGDELEGRPAWILAGASLAVAAAVRGQPTASLAWGIALLLSGGVLFLTSIRDPRLIWLTLLGLLGISALPYSPTWNGARLYDPPFNIYLIFFLIAQVLLILGFIRHTLNGVTRLAGIERWVWLIYPFGLAVLPVSHLLFGLWTNPGSADAPAAGWWVGIVVAALAGFTILAYRRWNRLPPHLLALFKSLFSFGWLYQALRGLYRLFDRFIDFLTNVLEGEGGLLWAVLILLTLLSVIWRSSGS